MIHKETFQFLKNLKKNNSKEWFDANRTQYKKAKSEFETFIDKSLIEIGKFDKEIIFTTAKESIFRINRDIRFSRNKQPYKTNFGAFMAKGGRKGTHAGYYIHVEPDNCFLAGGIYMPSGPMLKTIRTEIFENISEFKEIINNRSFIHHFGKGLYGDKLNAAPRGFPKDFPDIELLKFKHYTVFKNEPDEVFQKPDFLEEVALVFQIMFPFNSFLNRAVE